jgi:ribosomal-protein-alanine N-acetyltransferase
MNTRETELTLAHVADAYKVATMSREIIEHGLQWSWTPERVGRCILSPDINVVTAKHDGDLVGFGIMFYGGSKAHLNLLGVDATWRSMGIGHRLLTWLEKCAITAGLECCQLELRESNRAARKFYTAHGYTEIERVRGYYQQQENAIRMARSLQEGYYLT